MKKFLLNVMMFGPNISVAIIIAVNANNFMTGIISYLTVAAIIAMHKGADIMLKKMDRE